ncbi:MAG: 50S ribosomal protein L32e [DPANN group archaeon]|nr:50S ribosomal protein L32e [DPANN group archaeon]
MISEIIKSFLEKRKEINKRKPVFRRSDIQRKKIGSSWRKPTGRHNKIRKRIRGSMPHPSYSSPRMVRGLHASGYKDILINNVKELLNIDIKTEVARIAGTVGTKKRIDIMNEAKKMEIRILNPGIKTLQKLKELKEKETKKDTTVEKAKETVKKTDTVKKEIKTEKAKEPVKKETKTKDTKK